MSMEKHTGARALRAILEEYMLDIMYEIPKDDSIGEVIITKEYIQHTGGPKILLRGQELCLSWRCRKEIKSVPACRIHPDPCTVRTGKKAI